MSSKKTTTTQNSNTTSNSTSTPNVPDWLLNPTQTLAGNVGALTAQGSSAYTPTTSALQNTAISGAQNLDTSGSGYTDAATTANGVSDVTPQSLLTNLDAYENPYKDQVVNSTLSDFDANAAKTRAAQAAAAATNGAFGGSRYGVQEASTEDALARARASTESGLLSNMFTTATGLSQSDAAARQQAMESNQAAQLQKAGLLSNIATASGTDARANLATQEGIGVDATNAENTAKQYPLAYQQSMESLLSGLNPAMFTGSSTSGTGTQNSTGTSTVSDPTGQLLQGLGSAAQIAALFTPAAPLAALSIGAKMGQNVAGVGNGMDVMGLY